MALYHLLKLEGVERPPLIYRVLKLKARMDRRIHGTDASIDIEVDFPALWVVLVVAPVPVLVVVLVGLVIVPELVVVPVLVLVILAGAGLMQTPVSLAVLTAPPGQFP